MLLKIYPLICSLLNFYPPELVSQALSTTKTSTLSTTKNWKPGRVNY